MLWLLLKIVRNCQVKHKEKRRLEHLISLASDLLVLSHHGGNPLTAGTSSLLLLKCPSSGVEQRDDVQR